MSEHSLYSPEHSPESFSIVLARAEDADGIFDVRRDAWLQTYPNVAEGITEEDIKLAVDGANGEKRERSIERFQRSLESEHNTWTRYVAKENDTVIGFVAPDTTSGQRRVGALYVSPSAQGKGVGHMLLEKAIAWHGRDEDIFLHVATYNEKAIAFYKKHGFVLTEADVTDFAATLPSGNVIPEFEMILKRIV